MLKFKKYKYIITLLFSYLLFTYVCYFDLNHKKNIKVALCTMGKKENLYAREFMEYYILLGVDHIFIYDNNDPFTEKIQDTLDTKYKNKVTFYETLKLNISNQAQAFTNCYKTNYNKFDWFIMADMDEYLHIINDNLKNYLNQKIFGKCDFIKIHWANSLDNNLLYYDSRPLFKRFKKPYIKSKFIKTIIRGNISNLKYWVHSPYFSPIKNVTCTNDGKIIKYSFMNFQSIEKININKAYFIHFRFKSTEELINKFKRGYSYWYGNNTKKVLLSKIAEYFQENGLTLEKINLIERELKLNLSHYKNIIKNKIIKKDILKI